MWRSETNKKIEKLMEDNKFLREQVELLTEVVNRLDKTLNIHGRKITAIEQLSGESDSAPKSNMTGKRVDVDTNTLTDIMLKRRVGKPELDKLVGLSNGASAKILKTGRSKITVIEKMAKALGTTTSKLIVKEK